MNKQLAYKTTRDFIRFGLLVGLLLAAPAQAESRWYDQVDIDKGAALFKQNCASCHGQNGEGTADWKTTDANGNYPPPPLNGTAHTWHHSLPALKRTIREGGIKLGGLMPAFQEKLSEQQFETVIAYFQSKWPDNIYQAWTSRNQPGDLPSIAPIEDEASQQQINSKAKLTELLKLRLGSISFSEPVETPVDGIYMTQFGSNYGYLTEDGRYVFIGNLIDLKQGNNLTDLVKRKNVVGSIAGVPIEDKILFQAKGEEKAVLNIFTDTSCPYCQKLHGEIAKLQEAGISVHYLPYPRGGIQGPGYATLKQVWCATDRARAMTIAKGLASGELPSSECEDAGLVDEGYRLGNKIGVTGTPALYKSSGELITGYVPYRDLIPRVLN